MLSAASTTVGWARTGDFGRTEAVPGFDLPVIAPVITDPQGEPVASAFPLTDEERELRQLARNLLVPRWVDEGGFAFPDPAPPLAYVPARLLADDYLALIVGAPFRSSSARYARLIDDIRDDLTRMGPFFRLARRVADLDGKRERSLAFVQQLSPQEIADARRRIRENMTVMTDVQQALLARAAIYRLALERLVIAVPSPRAADAERLCAELDRRAREIEIVAQASGRERPLH